MTGTTRRAIAVTAMVVVGTLVACGGETTDAVDEAEGDVAPATSPSLSSAAPAEADSGTRVVVDFRGEEVEVPAEPQRVAVIDLTPTINLALLGVSPVTAPQDMTPFLDTVADYVPEGVDLDGHVEVGFPATGLNVEALTAAQPDLIMGYSTVAESDPAVAEQLQQIAPTVLYEFGANADWRERFQREADILGREDEAQELEARYEDVAAEAGDADVPPVAFVRLEIDGGGTWRLEDPTSSIPGSVLTDAGLELFQPPADVGELNDTRSFYPDISAERLDILDGAGAIVVQDLSSFGQEVPLGQFAENPLWQRLPAVQRGNVIALPAEVFNGGTYPTGILTIEAVLDAFGQ